MVEVDVIRQRQGGLYGYELFVLLTKVLNYLGLRPMNVIS